MPKGGYKPNAGRPRKPDSELSRPRQKKPAAKKPVEKDGWVMIESVEALIDSVKAEDAKSKKPRSTTKKTTTISNDEKIEEKIIENDKKIAKKLTPLEFALQVMNDETQEDARRDRMAIAALPFMHMKKGDGGKKESEKDNAHAAVKGKFNPSAPPKLAVVGK
jgi:hypothetical protein